MELVVFCRDDANTQIEGPAQLTEHANIIAELREHVRGTKICLGCCKPNDSRSSLTFRVIFD